MKTLTALLVLLVLFAAVTPAHAAPLTDEVKPACNTGHTWLDKVFGNCIDLTETSQKVQPAPTATPQEHFPTMDACKNWTRLFDPNCK